MIGLDDPRLRQPRVLFVARWAAFLAASWLVLRPALVVTISLDDFVNPFFVYDQYASSPLGMIRKVSRDLTNAGHFNHIGQNFGAFVYAAWAYLIGWGVPYPLIYAATKFVVLVLAATVTARVLRRVAALLGRQIPLWSSRVAVAAALFLTLQLHVAWSHDPVGSYPLTGYLSVVVGLWAFDLACVAMARADVRPLLVAAAAWCVAVLYYELNVVAVAAFVPIAAIVWRRAEGRAERRRCLSRAALMIAPSAVMTLVLQRIAAAANTGYTGTEVEVASGSVRVLGRALAGSVPGASWPQARDWLGGPFSLSASTAIALAAIATGALLCSRRMWSSDGPHDRHAPARQVPVAEWALALSVPLVLWLGATAVQAVTEKVRAETVRVGFVYLYYAYGSVAVAVLIVIAADWVRRARRRDVLAPVGLGLALAFSAVQLSVNDTVQQAFDERLAINTELLDAAVDAPPRAERCADLQAWLAFPVWQDYYREQMRSGLDALFLDFHDEPFCATP